MRAGHEEYGGEEGGRGAATLLRRHVSISDDLISLSFRGKGGKKIAKAVTDPGLARVLAELRQRRGGTARLFVEGGKPVTAAELNDWIRIVTHAEFTAKTFRTFHASSLAIATLATIPAPARYRARKRIITATAREVAELLQNTPAIARASYIHPDIIYAYESATLSADLLRPRYREGLTAAETALMRFLEASAA